MDSRHEILQSLLIQV